MEMDCETVGRGDGGGVAAAAGAAVPKTPVSLLQELYIRKGITPKYDLVQIEGAVHEPIFKYQVMVGDVMAVGSGSSKKKAKHQAAKEVLKKLKIAQSEWQEQEAAASAAAATSSSSSASKALVPASSLTSGAASAEAIMASVVRDVKLPDLDKGLLDQYDDEDEVSGNPVGELQEVCMSRRMKPPVYEVSPEETSSHERSFVVKCIVGTSTSPPSSSALSATSSASGWGGLVEVGLGKSKKQAKRRAAVKMLATLKSQPVIMDDMDAASGVLGIAASVLNGGAGPVMNSIINSGNSNSMALDEDDLASAICQRCTALKKAFKEDPSGGSGLARLDMFIRGLRLREGSKLAWLLTPEADSLLDDPAKPGSQLDDDDDDDEDDPCIRTLKAIGEEQRFSVTFVDVEQRSKSGKFHSFVMLSCVPAAVCYGVGLGSHLESRRNAAFNALNYLKLLVRDTVPLPRRPDTSSVINLTKIVEESTHVEDNEP